MANRAESFGSGAASPDLNSVGNLAWSATKAIPGAVWDAAKGEWKHATREPGREAQRIGGHIFNAAGDIVESIANTAVNYGNAWGNEALRPGQEKKGFIPQVRAPKIHTEAGSKVWEGGSLKRMPQVGTLSSFGVNVPGSPEETVQRGFGVVGAAASLAGGAPGAAVKGLARGTKAATKAAVESEAGTTVTAATKAAAEAAMHSPAKAREAARAANRENYLTEAAKNLTAKYNRETGRMETVADPYNMIIQKPLGRGDVYRTRYAAEKTAARGEKLPGTVNYNLEQEALAAGSKNISRISRQAAGITAADRTPSKTTPLSSPVVYDATEITKASGKIPAAAERAMRPETKRYEKLVKDVESAFPDAKPKVRPAPGYPGGSRRGEGTGKGIAGEGKGTAPGSMGSTRGPGVGPGGQVGKGRVAPMEGAAPRSGLPTATKPGLKGRPGPAGEEPTFRPKPKQENLKPLPYGGTSDTKLAPQVAPGKLGILEQEMETAPSVKPSFSATKVPSKSNAISPGKVKAISASVGSAASMKAASSAAAATAAKMEAASKLTTTTAVDTALLGTAGAAGGGGRMPSITETPSVSSQFARIPRVY